MPEPAKMNPKSKTSVPVTQEETKEILLGKRSLSAKPKPQPEESPRRRKLKGLTL